MQAYLPQDLARAVFQTSEFKPKLFALHRFSEEACRGSGDTEGAELPGIRARYGIRGVRDHTS